jgi:hypothetical protein
VQPPREARIRIGEHRPDAWQEKISEPWNSWCSQCSQPEQLIYIYIMCIYIYLYICYIYNIRIYQTVNWTFMSSRILIGIEMIFLLLTTVHSALHESRAEVSHNSPLQPGPWDAIFLPGCIDSTKIRII